MMLDEINEFFRRKKDSQIEYIARPDLFTGCIEMRFYNGGNYQKSVYLETIPPNPKN